MNDGEASVATIVPSASPVSRLTVVGEPSAQQELDGKLHQAREQLALLHRQQEELERQKGDLEDLRRKQDEYARGKNEMLERLTHGLVLLEREQLDAQRRAELCSSTRQAFQEQLEQLHALKDEAWTSTSLRSELTKALGTIENARLEYNRAYSKLDCLNPAKVRAELAGEEAGDTSEWLRYVKLGAAASLPLIIAGTIWLLIFLVAK
jgi:chromosome segregation ATPase